MNDGLRCVQGKSYRSTSEVAALMKDGERLRSARLKAADMMTVAEAAAELDIDALLVAKALAESRCIGIVDSAGNLRLPIWQFEPAVWFEIELIGEQLGSVDGWTLLKFLEMPSAALEGISPRMALERGIPRERVLAAAASYAH